MIYPLRSRFRFVKMRDKNGQLILSQTKNFRLFQNERLCRRQFQIFKKRAESSPKGYKTLTVGKGEIARYEQFLLSPQCFQKTCTADT